jgi:hypothetical protein
MRFKHFNWMVLYTTEGPEDDYSQSKHVAS